MVETGGDAHPTRVPRTPQQRRVIAVYLGVSGVYTLATSIIWGVNTLFLLKAGLGIFQVMLVNTAFTVGQLVFEVPTGVIADTLGRKKSLLFGVATLFVSTLLYVGAYRFGWGIWVFAAASVLIGLGFTFQTGAADAWLVDALDHTGWEGGKEQVFGWGGMTFGTAMLVGTLAGGGLGQIDLQLPYLVRSGVLAVCFATILVVMRDIGFTPRPLATSRFAEETRTILKAGVEYGWRHPVVRPLMFVSLAQGLFFIYGFYSLQPYLLDLLQRNLVWAVAAVTAAGSSMGIVGNSLVGRIMRGPGGRRRAGRVLALVAGSQALFALAIGLTGVLAPANARGPLLFLFVTLLWLAFSFGMGVSGPVRSALLNAQIPSAQRATVLSLDSFFSDVGGSVGQPGLGWIAQVASIPVGWMVGAVAMAAAVPLYLRADAADRARVPGVREGMSGESAVGE
jgi:MFS family permease